MNYYEILGIAENATEEEIKTAYRKLAKEFHPDRAVGDPEAAKKFIDIQQAHETLIDPVKRSNYDHRDATPSPSFHFGNIWEEFFGGSADRGRNVQVRVEIDLKDILTGIKKEIRIQQKGKCDKCNGIGYSDWEPCGNCHGSGKTFVRKSPFNIYSSCSHCNGTGKSVKMKCKDCLGTGFTPNEEKLFNIDIPPGMGTGNQIRIPNEGEPGRNGGRNGDVFVVIIVKPHPLFHREEDDLYIEVPVGYTELVLGNKLTVPTLEGKKIIFEIPKGSNVNTNVRLRNLGLPNMRTGIKGDLIALLKLEIPVDINSEYQELIDKLSTLESKYPGKNKKGFEK